MKLYEIDYADSIPKLQILQSHIDNASKLGTVDQQEVYGISDKKHLIAFTKKDQQVGAYIAISLSEEDEYNELVRMHNINSVKGTILSLIVFLHVKHNVKFKISQTEKLTEAGVNWLCKLIEQGHGLNITDLNGNTINEEKLKNSWMKARKFGRPTDFAILIKNINAPHKVFETQFDGILLPAYRYIDNRIILKNENFL